MEFGYNLRLSDNVRDFIQSKNYEKTIHGYMNESKWYFKGKYKHIPTSEQSHGEPDFISEKTGEKYDAKLLFSNEQCAALGKRPSQYNEWHKMIMMEINEVGECLRSNPEKIRQCKLYEDAKLRIEHTRDDEHVILFLPFPVDLSNEPGAGVVVQFASGVLSYTINQAIDDLELPKEKRVFSITPTLYGKRVAIREYTSSNLASNFIPEHLPAGNLLDYFKFEPYCTGNEEPHI
ncbi:MAG: hypothetical protein IKL80_03955 [Clostridia bacterium]|nr:hypothetical protein [Clostridia bacterium]